MSDTNRPHTNSSPWLSREEWASPTVYSGAKKGMIIMWVFALLFSILGCSPIVLGLDDILRDIRRGDYLVLVVFAFPLVSLFLLKQAIGLTLDWRRFGVTPLHMDPYPAAIGGQAGGAVDIKLPYDPARRFKAMLVLYRQRETGTGKDRSREDKVIWQVEMPLHAEPSVEGTRLRMLVDVPEGKPASEPPAREYYHWAMSIQCLDKRVRFSRKWAIPAFPGNRQAQKPLPASALVAHENQQLEELSDLTEITQQGRDVWLRYTAGNTRKFNLMMTVFGVVFAAIGVGITMAEGAVGLVFLLAFGSIGLIMALAGIYGLGKERRVCIGPEQLLSKLFWFGVPLATKEYPRSAVSHLYIRSNSSMSSSEGTIQYYKLIAKMRDGAKQSIGFGIDGYGKANKLGEHLAMLTGLEYRGDAQRK